jgi:hypothetical protein
MTPGSPVRIEMQKWGGRAHWSFDAVWLGTDEHGTWLGVPTGTHMARPGATYVNPTDQVCLVPDGHGWFATFHAPGSTVKVYVDMATPSIWHGPVVRAVDLDLDVVRRLDDSVYIDDEDEFAEHQVALGYPPEIVELAESSCAEVARLVEKWEPPFDAETHDRWLSQLAELGLDSGLRWSRSER